MAVSKWIFLECGTVYTVCRCRDVPNIKSSMADTIDILIRERIREIREGRK